MPIRFHNADIRFSLKQKRKLQLFIQHQINSTNPPNRRAGYSISLDFIFCSDEYLLDINRRFLEHDYYTDIITFDLSERNTGIPRKVGAGLHSLVSEIYISIDRVKENAEKYEVSSTKFEKRTKEKAASRQSAVKSKTKSSPIAGHRSPVTGRFENELHRVMFHGVLHLLGYKDKGKKDKELMRKKENQWLKQWAVANGQ